MNNLHIKPYRNKDYYAVEKEVLDVVRQFLKSPNSTQLVIHRCLLDGLFMHELIQILSANNSIQQLTISDSKITSHDKKWEQEFASLITKKANITSLDISGSEGLENTRKLILKDLVEHTNPHLEEMNISESFPLSSVELENIKILQENNVNVILEESKNTL